MHDRSAAASKLGARRIVAHSAAAPLTLLFAGLLIRVALLSAVDTPRWTTAEAGQAAIGFARTGFVADAYMAGQGPTAHLNPILPAYAGTIYRLFGTRSPVAEAVLASGAIATALASFTLLFVAFGRLGVARWARLLALAGCCLLPLFQGMETSEFRIWEGGFAVLLAAGFLAALLTIEDSGRPIAGVRAMGMALLAALLLFISPAFGVAAYLAAALSMVATVPARRWPGLMLLAAGMLALIVVPWAVRNDRLLGHPVLLRSNFGLELGMGYDPAALHAGDRSAAFHARQDAIHPFNNPVVFARMEAAGGEVAYANRIGEQTKAWIRVHPADAARLTLQHVRDYLFPPLWIMKLYYASSPIVLHARQMLLWAISLLGIAGAGAALRTGKRRPLYPVLFIVAPTLLYAITTPVIRYHYAIFAFSLFLGSGFLARLPTGRLRRRFAL